MLATVQFQQFDGEEISALIYLFVNLSMRADLQMKITQGS